MLQHSRFNKLHVTKIVRFPKLQAPKTAGPGAVAPIAPRKYVHAARRTCSTLDIVPGTSTCAEMLLFNASFVDNITFIGFGSQEGWITIYNRH